MLVPFLVLLPTAIDLDNDRLLAHLHVADDDTVSGFGSETVLHYELCDPLVIGGHLAILQFQAAFSAGKYGSNEDALGGEIAHHGDASLRRHFFGRVGRVRVS